MDIADGFSIRNSGYGKAVAKDGICSDGAWWIYMDSRLFLGCFTVWSARTKKLARALPAVEVAPISWTNRLRNVPLPRADLKCLLCNLSSEHPSNCLHGRPIPNLGGTSNDTRFLFAFLEVHREAP